MTRVEVVKIVKVVEVERGGKVVEVAREEKKD